MRPAILAIAALMLLLASPLLATSTVTVVPSQQTFLQDLSGPYCYQNFSGPGNLPVSDGTLTVDPAGYLCTISSPGSPLVQVSGAIGASQAGESLFINFTASPVPVTAVGGTFFGTDLYYGRMSRLSSPPSSLGADLDGDYTGAEVQLTLSDGSVVQYQTTADSDFQAFFTSSVPILSLSVTPSASLINVNMDDVYMGSALPDAQWRFPGVSAPVPEPLTMLTGILAVGSLGAYVRKHTRHRPGA